MYKYSAIEEIKKEIEKIERRKSFFIQEELYEMVWKYEAEERGLRFALDAIETEEAIKNVTYKNDNK